MTSGSVTARKIVSCANAYRKYYVNLWRRDPHTVLLRKWKRVRGDETLRVNYPLSARSVVFDVGAYKGEWSRKLYLRYGCRIHAFEPVKEYYDALVNSFGDNRRVEIYNYALLDRNGREDIHLAADGTGFYRNTGEKESVILKDVAEFIVENDLNQIDLIKINIEGAEYKLLNRMITSTMVSKCRDIQIQFHRCLDNYEEEYLKIRSGLLRTHHLTYEFPFLWENWRINT